MAKKPTITTNTQPALVLASRLQAWLRADPDFDLDDARTPTRGIDAPGAMFHVTDQEGRRWRGRVISQG